MIPSSFVVWILAVGDTAGFAVTGPRLPPDRREMAELQLRGMKDSRDRLASGAFRAKGRRQRVYPKSPPLDAPVEFYCAFDYARGLFRLDRDMPVLRSGTEPDSKPAVVREKSKYARTPLRSFHWSDVQPGMVTARDSEAQPAGEMAAFDPRALGLLLVHDLEYNSKFEQLLAFLTKQELIEVVQEGPRICRLTWAFGKDNHLRRTVWFDREQGYAPVRMELRRSWAPEPPMQTSETTWAEVSGAWVPKSFSIQEEFSPGVRRYQLSLDWESVNKPIAETLFTAKGLELKEDAQVVSVELGKPILLGHTSDDDLRPLPSADRRALRVWIAAITGAVLLTIVAVWILRRRVRARHS